MPLELECPVCEANIPLEGDESPDDLIMCSYCKMTLKLLNEKGKWVLVEEFEE